MAEAAIMAGGSLLNGYLGSKAAGKAGKQQAAGYDQALGQIQGAQGNFQPYMAAGQTGLNGLNSLAAGDYSGFNKSPDYLYARDQAVYGLDHSAAAQGRLYSGGYGPDLANALNGIASQNLGNYRTSLQWLGNLGMQGAQGYGNLAGTMANLYTGQGNAAANATTNKSNAWQNAIGGATNSLGGLFAPTAQTQSASSYGGGGSAGNFGLPAPVNAYQNTYYGT